MTTQAVGLPAKSDVVNEAERRLLESALNLFSEKGYEATSVREIIEGAGVTRPVLYYYFVNKEDLYKRLVEATFAEIGADFAAAVESASDFRERLKAVICKAFQHVEETTPRIRLILQVFFSPPRQGPRLDKERLWRYRFGPLVRIMRDALGEGKLPRNADPETLALAFSGLMDIHIMTRSNRPDATLTPELAEGLVDLFLAGAGGVEAAGDRLKTPFDWTRSK